jgi:hypothetical protein
VRCNTARCRSRTGYSHMSRVPEPNNNETIDFWMQIRLKMTQASRDFRLPILPEYAAADRSGYEYIRITWATVSTFVAPCCRRSSMWVGRVWQQWHGGDDSESDVCVSRQR